MGYEPRQFLHDSEAGVHRRDLKREILLLEKRRHKGHSRPLRGLCVGMLYLKTRSPHENHLPVTRLIERLRGISDPEVLRGIDAMLKEWVQRHDLNPCLAFAQFFGACDKPRMGFSMSGGQDDMIVSGNL